MSDPGFFELLRVGGWVMYPLLALSVVSLTLCIERAMFWLRHGEHAMRSSAAKLVGAAKAQRWAEVERIARSRRGVVGAFARTLLRQDPASEGGRPSLSEADVVQAVEFTRGALERFSAALSATITAAPMLGILGTVTGIIRSFRLLGADGPVSDPISVAGGIAEALITTAFGLVIALVTLFPYTVFRARADRTLGQLEALGHSLAAASRRADSPDG